MEDSITLLTLLLWLTRTDGRHWPLPKGEEPAWAAATNLGDALTTPMDSPYRFGEGIGEKEEERVTALDVLESRWGKRRSICGIGARSISGL